MSANSESRLSSSFSAARPAWECCRSGQRFGAVVRGGDLNLACEGRHPAIRTESTRGSLCCLSAMSSLYGTSLLCCTLAEVRPQMDSGRLRQCCLLVVLEGKGNTCGRQRSSGAD